MYIMMTACKGFGNLAVTLCCTDTAKLVCYLRILIIALATLSYSQAVNNVVRVLLSDMLSLCFLLHVNEQD